jgi:hypothetical protein
LAQGPDGPPIEPGVVVGVAAVLVRGEAPDGAGDLEDGLFVQGVEGEGGPGDAEVVHAVAVLALEAAELLDELALLVKPVWRRVRTLTVMVLKLPRWWILKWVTSKVGTNYGRRRDITSTSADATMPFQEDGR